MLSDKLIPIRAKLAIGAISYEDAVKEAAPVILEMNIAAKNIAKKYGKKHRPFSFPQLMR